MVKSEISKASSSQIRYQYKPPMHERALFHYILGLLSVIALIVGSIALLNTYQFKKSDATNKISVEEFLKKLTAHPEAKSYVGTAPLNIVQINSNNFANLQSQISGLDISYLGNYLVQYSDRIFIFDFDNDKLKGNVGLQQTQNTQIPNDFFVKLNKHAEMQGLENEKSFYGQLDKPSLDTLKQQFPDIYANAKTGDFLLRFKSRLIIYDYANDKIVNAVSLS